MTFSKLSFIVKLLETLYLVVLVIPFPTDPRNAEPDIIKPATVPCKLHLIHDDIQSYYQVVHANFSPLSNCTSTSPWSMILLTFEASVKGRQFDRVGAIWIDGIEIVRLTTAEPTRAGISWNFEKDISYLNTYFNSLCQDAILTLIIPNNVDSTYTGIYHVDITISFYSSDVSNHILPLSDDIYILPLTNAPMKNPGFPPSCLELYGSHNHTFDINILDIIPSKCTTATMTNIDTTVDDTTTTSSTSTTTNNADYNQYYHTQNLYKINNNIISPLDELYIEIYATPHGNEEFYYGDLPDDIADAVGGLSGGTYRELQVYIDNDLVQYTSPFPVIYTGGIQPALWRPLTGIYSFNVPSYKLDLSPYIGLLCDDQTHTISISISGNTDGGYWLIDASLILKKHTYDVSKFKMTHQVATTTTSITTATTTSDSVSDIYDDSKDSPLIHDQVSISSMDTNTFKSLLNQQSPTTSSKHSNHHHPSHSQQHNSYGVLTSSPLNITSVIDENNVTNTHDLPLPPNTITSDSDYHHHHHYHYLRHFPSVTFYTNSTVDPSSIVSNQKTVNESTALWSILKYHNTPIHAHIHRNYTIIHNETTEDDYVVAFKVTTASSHRIHIITCTFDTYINQDVIHSLYKDIEFININYVTPLYDSTVQFTSIYEERKVYIGGQLYSNKKSYDIYPFSMIQNITVDDFTANIDTEVNYGYIKWYILDDSHTISSSSSSSISSSDGIYQERGISQSDIHVDHARMDRIKDDNYNDNDNDDDVSLYSHSNNSHTNHDNTDNTITASENVISIIPVISTISTGHKESLISVDDEPLSTTFSSSIFPRIILQWSDMKYSLNRLNQTTNHTNIIILNETDIAYEHYYIRNINCKPQVEDIIEVDINVNPFCFQRDLYAFNLSLVQDIIQGNTGLCRIPTYSPSCVNTFCNHDLCLYSKCTDKGKSFSYDRDDDSINFGSDDYNKTIYDINKIENSTTTTTTTTTETNPRDSTHFNADNIHVGDIMKHHIHVGENSVYRQSNIDSEHLKNTGYSADDDEATDKNDNTGIREYLPTGEYYTLPFNFCHVNYTRTTNKIVQLVQNTVDIMYKKEAFSSKSVYTKDEIVFNEIDDKYTVYEYTDRMKPSSTTTTTITTDNMKDKLKRNRSKNGRYTLHEALIYDNIFDHTSDDFNLIGHVSDTFKSRIHDYQHKYKYNRHRNNEM